MIQLQHGDCLELMKDIPSGSVDLILTDPPYGTTACKWDSVIPFEPMWEHLNRIIKSNGAICLFGSEPFSSALRMSNIKHFKYDWIWEKEQGANFMLCKYQPYKVHEIVSVFSKATHKYFPQMTEGKPYISGKGTSGDITGNILKVQTKNEGKRYPRSVQKFCTDKSKSKHPTQKPVALLEYLIRTYTNEGETVLDFTMGSGSTGVACVNLNRDFIGMELKQEYFNIATERINDARLNQQTGGAARRFEGKENRMTITLGGILDLHDPHRDSNEIIHLMDEDGEPAMSGPVSSPYWAPFEDWQVASIEAAAPRHMNVWLKEEAKG